MVDPRGILLLVLVASAAPALAPAAAQPERLPLLPGEVLNAVLVPWAGRGSADAGSGGRVVLVEVYTATWCPPCADADRALGRLLDEYNPPTTAGADPDEPPRLAALFAHPWPDTGRIGLDADPFGVPEGSDRMQNQHGALWFPTTVFDGVLANAPDPGNVTRVEGAEERLERTYRAQVESRLAVPAAAGLDVAVDAAGGIAVTVRPHATVGARALLAHVALVEDHVDHAGANGVRDHRFTLRELLEPEAWRGPAAVTFDRRAEPRESWNASRLHVVAWAETVRPVPEAAALAGELFLFAVASAALLAAGLALPRLLRRKEGTP